MLFFAVSSAGSCSPTSLPGFRHPGFRLSFRSSLLSGSLPSSRHSSRSSPFSPVLSPLGSLSGPLYPLPGFLFSSCSPPLVALLLPACPLLPARTLLLPARPLLFPALLPSAPSFSPPAYSRSRSEPPVLRSRSSSRSARLSRIESRIVQRLSNSWASMRGCSSLTTRMMSFIAT